MNRKQHTTPEREETLHLILAAAQRLFMAHGYRAVTTRQVAQAVGLTQPALYHHFPTKEDLFIAVSLHEANRIRTGIEHILRRDTPPLEQLQALSLFLLTTVDYDFPSMYHDISAKLRPKSRVALQQAFHTAMTQPITAVMQTAQEQGLLPQAGIAPRAATWLFLSFVRMFLHYNFLPALPNQGDSDEATASLLVNCFLYGVVGLEADHSQPVQQSQPTPD